MIPDCSKQDIERADYKAFEWKLDPYWEELEVKYKFARELNELDRDSILVKYKNEFSSYIISMSDSTKDYDIIFYEKFLQSVFEISPLIAASYKDHNWYIDNMVIARNYIKKHSIRWDKSHREIIYKLLYGMRASGPCPTSPTSKRVR